MTDFLQQVSSPQEDRRKSSEFKRNVLDHHISHILPKTGEFEQSHTRASHRSPKDMKPPQARILRPERKDPFTSTSSGSKPINKRPPWVGLGTATNAMNGSEIQAPLGKMNRHANNKQQKHDAHFLQTLRVHNDPNVQWRDDKIHAKLAMDDQDDELPAVFVRLTDPSRYPSSHARRFLEDGSGAGLEGRRDDPDHMVNVSGSAKILRDDDPEMDSPHKPIMSWEEDKLRSDAYYSADMDQSFKSEDAYDDHTMTHGVHGRLSSVAAIPEHKSRDSEYERMQQVRKDYKVDACHVFKWQAFTDEIGAT
eukprot:m.32506 g.32506  ORF g.32506 m.32506 type:complete len:308 (-) comp16656_c0_seq1:113-1036(-)